MQYAYILIHARWLAFRYQFPTDLFSIVYFPARYTHKSTSCLRTFSLRSLAVLKQFEGVRKAGKPRRGWERDNYGFAARFRSLSALFARVQMPRFDPTEGLAQTRAQTKISKVQSQVARLYFLAKFG